MFEQPQPQPQKPQKKQRQKETVVVAVSRAIVLMMLVLVVGALAIQAAVTVANFRVPVAAAFSVVHVPQRSTPPAWKNVARRNRAEIFPYTLPPLQRSLDSCCRRRESNHQQSSPLFSRTRSTSTCVSTKQSSSLSFSQLSSPLPPDDRNTGTLSLKRKSIATRWIYGFLGMCKKWQQQQQQWLSKHGGLRQWTSIFSKSKKSMTTLLLALTFFLGAMAPFTWSGSTSASAAVSGGRSGGSFAPKARLAPSSSARSYSPSSSSSYSSQPPGIGNTGGTRLYFSPLRNEAYPRTSTHHHYHHSMGGVNPLTMPGPQYNTAMPRLSTRDVAILTGTGMVILYGVRNRLKQNFEYGADAALSSPLGPGATVATVTVSLQVPNRDDPYNLLDQLKQLSDAADTTQRKSVQNLVSDVSLALLRQESAIVSAATSSSHFRNVQAAQREFQTRSIQNRRKLDREAYNNFAGREQRETKSPRQNSNSDKILPKSTTAVVTVTVAIEGDSTMLPKISTRQDLMQALSKLSTDAQTEECLLSAEILWAPEDRSETLTRDDVYVDYPELVPL